MARFAWALTLIGAIGVCQPVLAQKFVVDGSILIYDTSAATGDEEADITFRDADRIVDILRENSEVTDLHINSDGGRYFAGLEIGRVVTDFELNTHILNECSSSCFYIFLGGVNRTMARGGKMGLHHTSWSAASMESYYEDEKESEGWAGPFDFASDMYLDTQQEIYEELFYVTSRGVEPSFALETIKVRQEGLWFPTRRELLSSGVLTE